MQVFRICIVTLLLASLAQCQQTNYCIRKICPRYQLHIGCNNDGSLAKNCASDAELMPLSEEVQTNILGLHNALRNQIASGNVEGFQPAARMATMVWDPELAYLAELNVKRCRLSHDRCRSTINFPYAGQNLAYNGWSDREHDMQDIVLIQIHRWYDEHVNATMKNINSYNQEGKGMMIAHFTQMIQEKATHLGCAVLRQTQNDFTEQFTACNYAVSNMISQPVYTVAEEGGENCTTGNHKNFESLCSPDEIYD